VKEMQISLNVLDTKPDNLVELTEKGVGQAEASTGRRIKSIFQEDKNNDNAML
jgi:hypothetical protein